MILRVTDFKMKFVKIKFVKIKFVASLPFSHSYNKPTHLTFGNCNDQPTKLPELLTYIKFGYLHDQLVELLGLLLTNLYDKCIQIL